MKVILTSISNFTHKMLLEIRSWDKLDKTIEIGNSFCVIFIYIKLQFSCRHGNTFLKPGTLFSEGYILFGTHLKVSFILGSITIFIEICRNHAGNILTKTVKTYDFCS